MVMIRQHLHLLTILDRLVSRSQRLEIKEESMRKKRKRKSTLADKNTRPIRPTRSGGFLLEQLVGFGLDWWPGLDWNGGWFSNGMGGWYWTGKRNCSRRMVR